jgi:hypothetical protein
MESLALDVEPAANAHSLIQEPLGFPSVNQLVRGFCMRYLQIELAVFFRKRAGVRIDVLPALIFFRSLRLVAVLVLLRRRLLRLLWLLLSDTKTGRTDQEQTDGVFGPIEHFEILMDSLLESNI